MFGKFKEKLKSLINDFSEEETREEIIKEEPEPVKQDKKDQKSFSLFDKTISEKDLDNFLFEMELTLLENNLALEVSQKIIEDIKKNLLGKKVSRRKVKEIIYSTLKDSIRDILTLPKIDLLELSQNKKPVLITFIGFNGSGKTTTIAKIGKYLQDHNKSVVFAAADSFRSAAIEQLEEHGRNLNIKVIKQKYGADPAAIIYDAVNYAKSKGIDYVLADTAGRVHTDKNLIQELSKIVRVNNPDLKIFVAESIAGNDIVEQAKIFNNVGIDAVILTKADVDEKGGTTLSLAYTLKKPILFYGTGQEYKDLKEFNIDEVINNLLN